MKVDFWTGALRWMLAALMVLGGMTSAQSQGRPDFLWLASGTSGEVREVAFSPDGKILAAAAGEIVLRNTDTGSVIRSHWEQSGFGYSSHAVAFSPDGKMLAGGFTDGPLVLWDVETGALLRKIGVRASPQSMTFSPDSKFLVVGEGDSITFWNVQTGAKFRTLSLITSRVNSVVFSPDGKTMATACGDGRIRLFNASTGTVFRTLSGHTDECFSVAFSPDGMTLASGSHDRTLKVWDMETGTMIRSISSPVDQFLTVVFLADGKTIATGSFDPTIKLWDTATGSLKRTLDGHRGWITSLAVNADGKRLASGSTDGRYTLWDIESGKPLRLRIFGSTSLPTFSPDGQTILFGSYVDYKQSIKVWAVDSGEEVRSMGSESRESIRFAAFGADAKTVVSTDWSRTIKLWDPLTGSVLRSLLDPESGGEVVALSPASKVLALSSVGGYLVKLRDASTLLYLRPLQEGTTVGLRSLEFSPDGSKLVGGSQDGIVRIWDVQTGSLLRTLEGHADIVFTASFSPDGLTVASGSADKTIKLWNVESGALNRTLIGHTQSVRDVEFSPDGRNLGSAGADFLIVLWDLSTGSQLKWYTTYTSEWGIGVGGLLDYSPDGAKILLPGLTSLGVMANPYARVISGEIELGGWGVSPAGVRVEVEIFPVGGAVPLQTTAAWLREDGKYSFAMRVPDGTYDLAAKGPTWLKQRLSFVNLSTMGAEDVRFALINGDCDGDNEVTIFDYIELSQAFSTVPGNSGWNPTADLNGDGEVTVLDYIILSNNFGLQGD